MGSNIITPTAFYPMVSQEVPDEGPIAVPLLINFASFGSYSLDMTLQVQQKKISMVQTLYIDLSAATADMTVTFPIGGQVIHAVKGTQGYYSVLCPNPPRMVFANSSGSDLVPVFLINVPIAGVTWSAT
jgi:hypothetical protein